MENETTLQSVTHAINGVEHPEIAATLSDLGMIGEITYTAENKTATVLLLLPTLGIPEQVRNYILNSIVQAIKPLGVQNLKYKVDEMDQAAKQQFFSMAQQNWKL